MALVYTDKTKELVKKKKKEEEESWKEIKDLIRSININPDDYDEKYIEIKIKCR